MSLGIVIKGPEGIVLAADTRVTITPASQGHSEVYFDNASKLLTFGPLHNTVAAVTYGAGSVGGRTPHSLIPEFQSVLPPQRLSVLAYATLMANFFLDRWNAAGHQSGTLWFLVGGINQGQPYGEVYTVGLPNSPTPTPWQPSTFGAVWGGQLDIVHRIINGYDLALRQALTEIVPGIDPEPVIQELQRRMSFPIRVDMLPLQDCIDMAIFLIRTTMTAQSLSLGTRGVGGAIEVVTITPAEGMQWIQRREIHGERT